MDGWGQLGANMFGGSGQAYQQGVGQGVDLQTKLMRARQMAQEETARSKMAEAMLGMGASPEEAQSLATIFNAGHNPTQATGSMLDLQQRDQRGQIWDQAQGGASVAALNPLLAALNGEAVDTTKVSGGVSYNPTVEPGIANMFQTPESTAKSRQLEAAAVKESALANAANTRAGLYGAQAELSRTKTAAGGWKPGSGGSSSYAAPSGETLDRHFSNSGESKYAPKTPDVEKQQEFLVWQAYMSQKDPRYRDGEYALAMYMAQNSPGIGNMFVDGDAVPQRVDLAAPVVAPAVAPAVAPTSPRLLPKGEYTQEDADELVAAAERAIAGGKDRKAVEDRLRQNLEAMGFSYGGQ